MVNSLGKRRNRIHPFTNCIFFLIEKWLTHIIILVSGGLYNNLIFLYIMKWLTQKDLVTICPHTVITILLTTFPVLNITSLWLIWKQKLVSLNLFSCFTHSLTTSFQKTSIFFSVYVCFSFVCFDFYIPHISEILWHFLIPSWFIHVVTWQNSFSVLFNGWIIITYVCVCVYAISSLSMQIWMDT